MRIIRCIDTSEVYEWLIPRSASKDDNYPTLLDAALLVLFEKTTFTYMLPAHCRELRSLITKWKDNLQETKSIVEAYRDGITYVRNALGQCDTFSEHSHYETLRNSLLENRSLAYAWTRSAITDERRWDRVVSSLLIPNRRALEAPQWAYEADEERIKSVARDLDRCAGVPVYPHHAEDKKKRVSNVVDARAAGLLV